MRTVAVTALLLCCACQANLTRTVRWTPAERAGVVDAQAYCWGKQEPCPEQVDIAMARIAEFCGGEPWTIDEEGLSDFGAGTQSLGTATRMGPGTVIGTGNSETIMRYQWAFHCTPAGTQRAAPQAIQEQVQPETPPNRAGFILWAAGVAVAATLLSVLIFAVLPR